MLETTNDTQILSLLRQVVETQAHMQSQIYGLYDRLQQLPVVFSPSEAHYLIDLQRRLRSRVPVDARFARVGGDNDGGYVMVDNRLDQVAVYNFGIGQEVTWDQAMADRQNIVFQFDHTIDAPPPTRGATLFTRKGLGATSDESFVSLHDALVVNGDQDRDDLVLNIDIEGGEWDILPTLDPRVLGCFSQIVIELHDLLHYVTDPVFRSWVQVSLDRLCADHTIVHVHANNNGARGVAGNVMGYDVLELTLVRSKDWTFVDETITYPRAFDKPNSPHRHEYPLGDWNRLDE